MASGQTKKGLLASVSALFFGVGGAHNVALAQEEVADDNARDVIVVTSQKREGTLLQAPAAISVRSEEQLKNLNTREFGDYARTVAGLTFSAPGTGTQTIAIRGVNPTIGDAATVMYMGNTLLPSTPGKSASASNTLNPQLLDINRIEVLKGPQGTLYGAGAVGGVVQVSPNKPDFDAIGGFIQGRFTNTKSGGQGYEVAGVLNLPIVEDKAATRTVAWYRDEDGYIDRYFPGGVDDNVAGVEVWGIRNITEFRLTDRLNVSTFFMREENSMDGLADITSGATNPNDALAQVFIADSLEQSNHDLTIISGDIVYEFDPFTFTSVTTYTNNDVLRSEEGAQLLSNFFGVTDFPNALTAATDNTQFTQEIRINSNEAWNGFEYVLGFFYRDLDSDVAFEYAPAGVMALLPFPYPDDNLFSGTSGQRADEVSFFGELTYNITDRLNATFGIRHYDTETRSFNEISGLFNGGPTPTTQDVGATEKGVLFKGNVSFEPTDDSLIYATFAEGFRPSVGITSAPDMCDADLLALGFTETPTQIDSDTVQSYEVGAKTSLGGRGNLTIAGYRIDWNDLQTNLFLPCGFSLGANSVTGAQAYGVEIEGDFSLTDDLSVGFAGSYVSAEFEGDEPALGAFEGDQLQDVPDFQVAAWFDYAFALSSDVDGLFHFDIQHTGESYADFARLMDGVTRDPQSLKGATTLLNVRTTASYRGWDVSIFGRNLTNDIERQERAISDLLEIPDRLRFSVNQPRTFGVEVRKSF